MFDILEKTKEKDTLSNLFELYISDCEYTKRLRQATLSSYRDVFETFQKIMPEIVLIKDISPQAVNEFFRRISTRKRIVGKDIVKTGVKVSTIRTYYNKLMAFFNWLEYKNHLKQGSLVKQISKPSIPEYTDEKELKLLDINTIISTITFNTPSDSYIYKRDMALLYLLLYTGIRKGELLNLRVKDIDFETRSIFINGATSKSKRNRTIPMNFHLIHCLKSYFKARKEKAFYCEYVITSSKNDTPFTQHGLKSWITKYKKASGISFHLHQFRHTFACQLARKNADIISIMKVLGHTTTKMTEIYLRSITTSESKKFINELSF